jgi:hypothetical protein
MERLVGIEPHEVMEALFADRRWPRIGVSDDTGLVTLTVWARTRAGRPLKVGLRTVGGLDRQIFGARELTPDEVGEFEEWETSR